MEGVGVSVEAELSLRAQVWLRLHIDIRQIPYLFLFCLVWWAFILFLYLLGIPLSLHLV